MTDQYSDYETESAPVAQAPDARSVAELIAAHLENLDTLKASVEEVESRHREALAEANDVVTAARTETSVKLDEVRAQGRTYVASVKEEADAELARVTAEAEALIAAAKAEATAKVDAAKSETAEEFRAARDEVNAELESVKESAEQSTSTTYQELEEARTRYAEGIRQAIETGWATIGGLEMQGHRAPKLRKSRKK